MIVPFPIQAMVWEDARSGRDTLARSKTGSGKTLGFALPIVDQLDPASTPLPAALVLVPTRELCQQVCEEFLAITDAAKMRVMAVYGGTNVKEQAKGVDRTHVLIATPGRLDDLATRGIVDLGRGPDPGARRGGSHARHGLPAAGRSDRATLAEGSPDDVLLRDARRRRRPDRAGVHARPRAARGGRLRPPDGRRGRSPVHARARAREARDPDQAGAEQGWAHPRIRQHEARSRLLGAPAQSAGGARAGAARRHAARGARPRAQALLGRARGRARGHRRRRARAGSRRHHPGRQLRRASGRQGVRPSGRSHGARGALGHEHHVRDARSAGRRVAHGRAPGSPRGVRAGGDEGRPPRVVFSGGPKGRRNAFRAPKRK